MTARFRLRRRAARALVSLAAALSSACGLENYAFLEQVPPDGVIRDNATAEVIIPSSLISNINIFLHFSVYYRIYISDIALSSTISESEMGGINSSLQNDYNYMKPYTQENNNLSANTGSLFSGRNYAELEIDEGGGTDRINEELDGSSFGKRIRFSFEDVSPGQPPRITVGDGIGYILRRSTATLKDPLPRSSLDGTFDGRFINTGGLNSSENATAAKNNDVANKTITSATRYTYVSLYICAVGINDTTLVPVYGAPTFIGVFPLPHQWETN